MNVTNIGSPFAAPASQGGNADATAAASGFAGLIGPAGTPRQGLASAGSGLPALGTAQPPLLTANTTTPLLATAAPAAVSPPVATGGNPLADAIAKALAKPVAAAERGANAPVQTPAPDALDAPSTILGAFAATGPTPLAAGSMPEATVPVPADANAKPVAGITTANGTMLALDPKPAAEQQPAAAALPRQGAPAKGNAKPVRATTSDEALPNPADLAAASPQQPIAVPQPIATAGPAAQNAAAPAPEDKSERPAAIRATQIEAAATTDGTPAPSTAEKTADLARAISGHGGGSHADSGAANDGGQQGFGQQLASADTRAFPGQPLPTSAAFEAAKPVTATPAATEPVLHARPGELGRSLGVEIARTVDAGEDTLRVRLNPAELGRVEVTLAFDDTGRMQATMRAESQHTLDLLRQDAPDLGRALDQAGIRNDAGSFRFENRDSGTGSNTGSQSGFQQQQSRSGNQRFQDEPEIPAAAYRSVRSDGQVDLIA
ncbi:flagellar hook-length control protein FliK [Sphingomonas elodea]|uniref:flagellar hook-length control protein FliK n=1 Tax=Sphingomonas elodea TaxID=179878 RepID=UPI0002631A8B|nr:flagellar hook-length control protein FliK [Sphingomonas elodea]